MSSPLGREACNDQKVKDPGLRGEEMAQLKEGQRLSEGLVKQEVWGWTEGKQRG